MSKTFKSSSQANDNRTLSVEKLYGEPRLMISGDVRTGFLLDPSDAPALALAVLEAAGVDLNESWSGLDPYGTPSHLGWIGGHLRAYVRQFANDQDKARELAELESEALELCNEFIEDMGYDRVDSWDGSVPSKKKAWLAVARRAREMRNEKKVNTDD